jgi:hypothetical protein
MVEVTPIKLFLSAVALSFVGILGDVSAMAPTSNLFLPNFDRLKMDLGTCSVSSSARECRSEAHASGTCEISNRSFLPDIESESKPACSAERAKVKRFLKLDGRS